MPHPMKGLPPDLHIHTAYCGHATGTMEESVLAAMGKGLDEIGFSDHFPYPPDFDAPAPDCVIPTVEAFESYAEEVRRLRSAYRGRIDIRFAAEVDFLDGWWDRQQAMLKPYPFDYVIGSVHIVDGVAIDYREDMLQTKIPDLGGIESAWDLYWDSLEAMIRRGGFHLLGHLDILKKYPSSISQRDHTERLRDLCRLLKERGIVLEVNTGGIDRASDGMPYPSLPALKLAAETGLDVALGSDAHAPAEVGRHFREISKRLAALGWRRTAAFRAGQKHYKQLHL